ncbi:MAG: putative bifunctional diguanylate cyclase/phosphodiesterase [Nocardioidaceae bacterium]
MSESTQPLLSRFFDGLVAVTGALLALGAIVKVVQGGFDVPWAMWISVPLVALIARYPLMIDRSSGALVIGFDSCVLAFVATMLPAPQAMLVWCIGAVLSQLLADVRRVAKVFNIGLMMLGGGLCTYLIGQLRGGTQGTLRELAAVAVGCIAYFAVDYFVSEVAIALEERATLLPVLRSPGVAVCLGAMVAVDSLGYLGALVVRSLPLWSVTLLAVPVVTLLVATRSFARSQETSRRVEILFSVSTEVAAADSPVSVLKLIELGARSVTKGSGVQLRRDPPGAGEVGAKVVSGTEVLWLVTSSRNRARSTPAQDRQHLEALAAVGDEALARVHLARRMTHLAQHDSLTQLANRAVFMEEVGGALVRCRQRAGRIAVLFCDLDGFKTVNDWFGHSAGDELLIDVSQRLAGAVGPGAVVARLGGDEFAVLMEDVDPEDDLSGLTHAVLLAVEQRFEFAGRFVTVTTSIGVAFSDGAHTSDQLLRNADMAMYEAKFAGKNQVVTYRPALGRERVRLLETAEALREAVERRELTVVYQPILRCNNRELIGIEALVRWKRDGEDVPPDTFVRIAEETGLVCKLGDLVMDLVANDAPALRAAAGGELTIGINISAHQLRSSTFVDSVRRCRDALDGMVLVLELTERQVVFDDPLVLSVIAQLDSLGVRLSLDDFGVGFSSIGYLRQLAVHILKTDRVFAATIDTEPRALALLASMVDMGRALGLDVVVEGLERESQVTALTQVLRDLPDGLYLQGYLLGRPMPLAAMVTRLRRARARSRTRARAVPAPLA